MIFAYHQKWMGPMVGPLLKMILNNNCYEGQPMESWHKAMQAGNKMQMSGMFQPSYMPQIQIWLVSGYSRLIKSRKKNESLQHKSTRWRCEILGEWTTIVSSKTWAGSATHMWPRCPRQAWPHSSLIIKHYRVQEGEPSSRISKFCTNPSGTFGTST